MATEFSVSVYKYTDAVDDAFSGFIRSLTGISGNMSFSTKNPGGFSELTFSVNTTNADAFEMYTTYHHYFIRLTGGDGSTAWEGRIEDITYEPGQVSFACRGLWSNAFDALYDDGSLFGDPGAEHPITESDSTRNINATYKYLAQSFQLSEARAIKDVAIRLANSGAPPGEYIRVWLAEGSSSSPGVPLANHTIDTADIQCEVIGSSETIFTGMNTDHKLEANTDYWIIIGWDSTVTADKVGWEYDSGSGYTGGVGKYYTSSWNAFSGDFIFYVYTHPRFYFTYGANSLSNPGFETAGGGGADVWANWDETAGDGTVANETTNIYQGADAAKLTAGATANTYIEQDVTVKPGERYAFSFMTRGDGTYGGRYSVYDNDNTTNIVAVTATGVTGTTYTSRTTWFDIPAGCHSISVRLQCPSTNTGIAYFDTVALRKDASAADVIYDAATESNFIQDSRAWIQDVGAPTVNPVAFTNNQKPGNVIEKVMTYGSSDSTPEAMFAGVYDNGYIHFRKMTDGSTWYVDVGNLAVGQQGISVTSSLSDMKTRVAVLYSDSVGSRALTTWITNTGISDQFGYNRDGLFSISGASEAVADLLAVVVAGAFSKKGQSVRILIEGVVSDSLGGSIPAWKVRAGDVLVLRNVLPHSPAADDGFDNIKKLHIQETSYDADTGRIAIVPTTSTRSLVDVILALAGLSGGSMV